MKLGFGIYSHQLDRNHLRFARQCGATHVVVHLVDYFNGIDSKGDQPTSGGPGGGWGQAGDPNQLWSLGKLLKIKGLIEDEGLTWYAIENIDPAHWYDVLLAGPERNKQLENICTIIETIGKAGIPVLGYNFSLAGVYGRSTGPWARGKAQSVGMTGEIDNKPMPDGMIWNMSCEAAKNRSKLSQIDESELWKRLEAFLLKCLPIAEKAGVILAAHPDDPPVPRLRNTPRLIYKAEYFQRLIDLVPSLSNQLEFCLGTLAEMPHSDIYAETTSLASQNKLAYIHCRNVIGKAPNYREVFIDEGDIDMRKVINILKSVDYPGVIIPDHAPQMSCDAPWHAGMAYTMGYLKSLLD